VTRLVECVPNFSEGRNRDVIDRICAEAAAVDGVMLLDVDPGAATNRTVVTLAGEPDAMAEGAFRAIRKAAELIDMSSHTGAHPRMGATDVCPFVPLSGTTMADCVELARRVGRRVGEDLGIPVFLYGEAATTPERRSLSHVRQGEYEGLAERLRDPIHKPDFGPAAFNPSSGAIAVGAREFLIAYNVTLNTRDRRLAHEIALNIREAGRARRGAGGEILRDVEGLPIKAQGRLKSVSAIGWFIEEYGRAQVSINLMNFKETPPHAAFEECVEEAAKLGLRVTGSEIVGLIPLQAMLMAGRYYRERQGKSPAAPEAELVELASQSLGLSDVTPFDPGRRIIEYRLRGGTGFAARPLGRFVDAVSADTPAPGGGSVSALCGSLAAALAAMVAGVTYLRPDAEGRRGELAAAGSRAHALKERLFAAIEEDSSAFEEMMAARRLKGKSPEELAERERMVLEATRRAIEVPLGVIGAAADVLETAETLTRIGAPSALSDVGVASLAALAAAEGAFDNVLINLPDLAEPSEGARLRKDAEGRLERARKIASRIRERVSGSLRAGA